MPQIDQPDFSQANGQQLRLLRVALVKTTKATGLDMVLSATRDSRLADLVAPGPFQEQVFLLLDLARREGWLNNLIYAALEEWPEAPELRKVVQTFSLIAAPVAPTTETSAVHETDAKSDRDLPPLERIIDRESGYLEPIVWVEALANMRNRVCRVEIGTHGFATGCLIAPDIVLTCHHNIIDVDSGENLIMRFDFTLAGAELRPGTKYAAASDWNILSEPHDEGERLNFALIRLATTAGHERMPDGEPRGWITLDTQLDKRKNGEAVAILHHPHAGPMKMSVGALVDVDSLRFRHNATTEPGSGGAGCFNMAL